MKPEPFFYGIVEPTLRMLATLPDVKIPHTEQAEVLLMTIAGQESRWSERRQLGISQYYPQKVGARGYWQFESTWGGPVAISDILLSTGKQIAAVCASLDVPCNSASLYEACAWNDTLACSLARLLLWLHPAKLPAVGDKEGAWQYYLRQWRPGAPHRASWDGLYDQSIAAMS